MSEAPIPFRTSLWITLTLFGLALLCQFSRLDLLLERSIYYSLEGGSGGTFPWHNSYLLYDLIHEGGRWLVKRLFFLSVFLLLAALVVPQLKPWRLRFLFVVLCTLLSTALISYLKHHTTLPCPQNLTEFGGDRHWVDIWQLFSTELPVASCYPAGHSSGGYAWLCLAFIFPYRSRAFYLALLPGALLGLVFGIAQQLRGAHFISHDLTTIAFCWALAALMLYLFQAINRFCQSLKSTRRYTQQSR
ncbi:phosphatase PAP2 family protein [Marinobacterium lutimaris]|uniref:Membrane-associated enzyme, PAP2 (Acid phosphatase) superfamily n=1 Tax=Marinobacterium lutimaris TaxID=568106 RepID=A0A1H6AMZ9_9GAMM|nr:phosphatase PAP2 family protein [Marinobacterium lutimaris]SEG49782.1 Membrane-associated enzyme, PAP2 (acid phosphatase) superfamily [Marinobacterium lutimaris]